MIQALRQTFFRFRVLLGALRTGIYGFAVVCAAWIFAAPPSADEIARLALPSAATASHKGVRTHRMAKLLMMIDSDQLYTMAARRTDPALTAADIRLNVILAAEGTSLRSPAPAEPGIGAKFVAARTN